MTDKMEFKSQSDGNYYPVSSANMSHKNYDSHGINPKTGEPYKDAVVAWNTDLKQYGAKSQEGYDFMHDSDQYYLELASINKSDGARLNMTYDDPGTPLRDVEDVYPDMKKDKDKNDSDENMCPK